MVRVPAELSTGCVGCVMESQRSKAVLVVDDHQVMLEVVTAVVRQAGFEDIDQATSGIDALAMMREKPYALVISDWNMEPVSGLQLLKFTRADPDLAGVRFIMLTANSQTSQQVAAHEAGADAYLVKPFSPDALLRKVRELL